MYNGMQAGVHGKDIIHIPYQPRQTYSLWLASTQAVKACLCVCVTLLFMCYKMSCSLGHAALSQTDRAAHSSKVLLRHIVSRVLDAIPSKLLDQELGIKPATLPLLRACPSMSCQRDAGLQTIVRSSLQPSQAAVAAPVLASCRSLIVLLAPTG